MGKWVGRRGVCVWGGGVERGTHYVDAAVENGQFFFCTLPLPDHSSTTFLRFRSHGRNPKPEAGCL